MKIIKTDKWKIEFCCDQMLKLCNGGGLDVDITNYLFWIKTILPGQVGYCPYCGTRLSYEITHLGKETKS